MAFLIRFLLSKKSFSLCSLWLIAFLGISINAFSQDFLSIEEEHQLLESELKLAKTPQLYFVFDLKKKEILIKSKGAILKELKIDTVRFWGQPVRPEPYTLIKKSTLLKPKREEIKPKKPEETEGTEIFDIKALELSDMPSSYRLTLKKGIVITIRPTPEGIFSTIFNAVSRANWYLSRPLLTLWNYLMGKPFTAIYLTLQKEDARSLYWSFTEGAESIIYNPYP